MQINKFFIIAIILLQIIGVAVFAEEPKKPEATKAADKTEDADISELADEYWRPSVDELEVIQNRRFVKKGRVEATASYGFYQGGDYVNSRSAGLGLTYNLSDEWAAEISYMRITNSDTDFLKSVRSQFGFTPNFNTEQYQYSAAMLWSPIYAKFSFLGKKISHFETYIGPGVGITHTAADHFTEHVYIGEKFYLTEHLIFRIEWKMSWYQDQIAATQGALSKANGGPGSFSQSTTKNNIIFGLGWMF